MTNSENKQTILTVNKLVEHLKDKDHVKEESDKVWVYFVKEHALKKSRSGKYLDEKYEELYFHPIKILIKHKKGLSEVELDDLKEEFDDDFGMKFKLTKTRSLSKEHAINILVIGCKEETFNDITYYPSNVGVYKNQLKFLDKLLKKNTSKAFAFRKVEKQSEFTLDDIDSDDLMQFLE